jgi:hypothetical protein
VSAAVEAAWQDAGWGDRRASQVPGHDLLFSLRWPLGWHADGLQRATGGEQSADSPLGRLRGWAAVPAAIATHRIRLALPRTGAPDVVLLAALSASLAGVGELPSAAEMGDDAQAASVGEYRGLRIASVRAAALGDAGPYVEMHIVRYLLETPRGLLALAFSALQPAFYDVLEPMFDAVAETVRLDPCRSW